MAPETLKYFPTMRGIHDGVCGDEKPDIRADDGEADPAAPEEISRSHEVKLIRRWLKTLGSSCRLGAHDTVEPLWPLDSGFDLMRSEQ